jgi:hypothetical protein
MYVRKKDFVFQGVRHILADLNPALRFLAKTFFHRSNSIFWKYSSSCFFFCLMSSMVSTPFPFSPDSAPVVVSA